MSCFHLDLALLTDRLTRGPRRRAAVTLALLALLGVTWLLEAWRGAWYVFAPELLLAAAFAAWVWLLGWRVRPRSGA